MKSDRNSRAERRDTRTWMIVSMVSRTIIVHSEARILSRWTSMVISSSLLNREMNVVVENRGNWPFARGLSPMRLIFSPAEMLTGTFTRLCERIDRAEDGESLDLTDRDWRESVSSVSFAWASPFWRCPCRWSISPIGSSRRWSTISSTTNRWRWRRERRHVHLDRVDALVGSVSCLCIRNWRWTDRAVESSSAIDLVSCDSTIDGEAKNRCSSTAKGNRSTDRERSPRWSDSTTKDASKIECWTFFARATSVTDQCSIVIAVGQFVGGIAQWVFRRRG